MRKKLMTFVKNILKDKAMKNKLLKGFSLIELLVVVAIIGILAGIAIVGYNSYVDNARAAVIDENARILARKIAAEQATPADFIDTNTGNTVLRTDTANTFAFAATNYANNIANFKNPVNFDADASSCTAANPSDGSITIYVTSYKVKVCYVNNQGSVVIVN